jgi:hypothetical protein
MTEVARLITPMAENNGTALTRFSALRHGILSRYTVLPWEDEEEYAALVASLVEEHAPQGPTEEHLVEELAGILWRKRRLRMAEGAAHRRRLDKALESYSRTASVAVTHLTNSARSDEAGDAVRTTAKDDADEMADLEEDEAMTRRAMTILGIGRNDAYEAALAELRDDTQEWWAGLIARDPDELEEGEEPATADTEGLRRFLEDEVLPWLSNRRKELRNRPLIRVQALGEALDPNRLEKLGRYEVHLDRKLERMLAMLIKLQNLRQPTAVG